MWRECAGKTGSGEATLRRHLTETRCPWVCLRARFVPNGGTDRIIHVRVDGKCDVAAGKT